MAPRPDDQRSSSIQLLPWAVAVLSVVVGSLVLVGWLLDVSLLKSLIPGAAAMRANTAIAFILLGGALWLLSRARTTLGLRLFGRGLAMFVCVTGASGLCELMFDWNLNLDEFLVVGLDRVAGTSLRGRMPYATALSFVLLSGSLLLLDMGRAYLFAQFMSIAAIMVSLLAITGYTYRVISLDFAGIDRSLAIHTLVLFISLAFGLLALRADQAVAKVVLSDDMGGVLARRLLPVAVGVPIVIGWLRVEGQRAGLYGTDIGVALFAIANVACFASVILWSATSLHRTDAERKLAAESVRESQGRFHAVIENMTEGVVISGLDGRLLHWNRAALDMHGFANSEEWCRALPDFVNFIELSTLGGRVVNLEEWPMSRLLRGEKVRNYQLRIRRLDIQWERVFSYGGDMVLDTTGSRVAFCTMIDITESKRAEVALRTSREMLQGVLNLIPLGVFWKDQRSRYLGCNAVVCRALGFSDPADIAGRTDAEMPSITADQAEFFVGKDREVMDADSPQFHVIEQLTRGDGTTIWLDTNKIPMHDDQGRVIGVLGTWEDITQRKQAEEAIGKYNERLRILHQIDKALIAGEEPSAIAAAALPFLRDLLGVRRAVVNLFDLTANEVEWLAAAGPRRIHVGPGVRYSMEFMGNVEALRRGELQFIDVAALPPGPEVAALVASGVHSYVVVPMIARGELIGALSFGGTSAPFSAEQISIAQEAAAQFAIAITQARLHESVKCHAQELELRILERTRELVDAHAKLQGTNAELMKLTAELKAANKELEAFSYSVSHDLRAPLRAIDGFSRIVLEDYASQLPEDGRTYLQDVRANTLQMGRLVDDLLTFSRLSRQPVNQLAVDSAQLVHQCFDELRRSQDGRHVEIRIGDLPPCQADPALLKQVWINLLANALKYTGKRESAVIEVGCQVNDGRRVYFVKDNGVGFDMRYAHKLFGVFQRLHRAEDYEGTGVGLAIVQRIIHRHGGQVWAEARIDHGAAFFFTLDSGEQSHDQQ